MKKLLAAALIAIIFVAVAALVKIPLGGGVSASAASQSQYGGKPVPDGLPKGDAVFGGGHFTFVTPRSFSLTAAGGTGTLQYGLFTIRAEITCLNVAGNAAVAGGIIRESAETSFVGDPVKMYFVDNGPPVNQAVGGDTVSPIFIFGPGDDAGGLPKVCPAVDATQATVALDAGDIVVHAKR
jgi:hypothetical protein